MTIRTKACTGTRFGAGLNLEASLAASGDAGRYSLTLIGRKSVFPFFRKKSEADRRDTEQLIFDIAEYGRGPDYGLLYLRMKNATVFLPVDPCSIPERAIPGERVRLGSSDELRASTVSLPPLGECIPVATTQQSPILQRGYVGIEWIEFLQMVEKMPGIAGVFLQGVRSWVAFDMERVRHIIHTDAE